MPPLRIALVIGVALALGGCASFREMTSGWFDETPAEPTPAATPAVAQGETFYAAVAGLAVRADPAGSSAIVGRLALHERVTRFDLQHGYAKVTAAESGLEGWVDNAQLLWRLPAAAASPAPVEPAPGAAAPAVESPPAEAATPAATDIPAAPATAVMEPTPTATPAQQPTSSGAAPAIFDPF